MGSSVVSAESEETDSLQRKIVVFKDGVSDIEKGRILSGARGVKARKLRPARRLSRRRIMQR